MVSGVSGYENVRYQFTICPHSLFIAHAFYMFPSIMHFNRWIRHILVVLVLLLHVSLSSAYRSIRNSDTSRACSFVKCKKDERCVNRKFLCDRHPCPSMLYCAKTRTELLRGPSKCDSVVCTKGYRCIVRRRRCNWNETCSDSVARCITEREYEEIPPTCGFGGFKCASGLHCILRESLCPQPPCKLVRSCATAQEVHAWTDMCQSLGCVSQNRCFLRKPRSNCQAPHCEHTPDCLASTDRRNKCNGYVCPIGQQCAYEVQRPCSTNDCAVSRWCHGSRNFMNDSSVPIDHHQPVQKLRFFNPNLRPSTPPQPWTDNFRLRNNAQAIKYLINEAKDEFPNNRTEFHQWLNSVKDILGQKAYDLWLDEIRAITINNEPFHDWFRTLDSRNSTDKITQQAKPLWNILRGINEHSKHENVYEKKLFDGRYENLSMDYFGDGRRQIGVDHLLRQLREGRHMYLSVINKTKELVSTVEQFLPKSHFDQVVKDVQRPPETRKALEQTTSRTVDEKTTTTRAPITPKVEDYRTSDYSDDNDTDFFLVDYGEGGHIELNQTVPRVIIRVENNMHQPIKISNVHLKYEENEDTTENTMKIENVTKSVYDQNDYQVDEFQYFRPADPNNSTKINKNV